MPSKKSKYDNELWICGNLRTIQKSGFKVYIIFYFQKKKLLCLDEININDELLGLWIK